MIKLLPMAKERLHQLIIAAQIKLERLAKLFADNDSFR
jgi:hypothetical protein